MTDILGNKMKSVKACLQMRCTGGKQLLKLPYLLRPNGKNFSVDVINVCNEAD